MKAVGGRGEVAKRAASGQGKRAVRWGSVEGTLIEHLRAADAEVVFSEVDEGAIRRFRDELGLQFVSAEAVYTTECDIFAPCALGGVLNANTIPQLKCRVVAGGANNQLAWSEDAESLRARGILYAPDYVIKVGGAMAILGLETQGWTQEGAEKKVVESVRRAFAIRLPETAHATRPPDVQGLGRQGFAVNLRNLEQLCVQVGAMSVARQLLPSKWMERVLPYKGEIIGAFHQSHNELRS